MTTRRAFLGLASAAIVAGAAPRLAWGHTQTDVAIIGAGLAGLNAARICEAAGLRVVVIEAEPRVGGRLHTLDDLPGAPEAGGIQVGAGYARLHAIAGELGVGLSSDDGAGAGRVQAPGNLYAIGGEISAPEDWPQSITNALTCEERDVEPAALLRHYARAFTRYDGVEDWLGAPVDLDISVRQALRNAGASDEALRLIEANFNGNDLSSMSQLHLARSFAIFRSQPGPISTIDGGSQRLPEAMASALGVTIRTNERVRAIAERADGVTLHLEGETLHARHAICTIPFAALRHIPVESEHIAPPTARMIAQLPYTRASFAYLSAREPFWRGDPFPDTLWTDDPLIGRVFVLGDDPAMLKLWTTGAGADMLDHLPEDAAARAIVERIELYRPSARGKIKVERLFSWQKSPQARGIYHHIGTGMARPLGDAIRNMGARLHLAGEHLAQGSSGMEAALESGERAARRVLIRQ